MYQRFEIANRHVRVLRHPAAHRRDEIDYCHAEVAEGVFTLTTHPEIIGRGPLTSLQQNGVVFSTIGDAAWAYLATE